MLGFNSVDKPTAAALHRMNAPEMQPLLTFLKNLEKDTLDSLVRADSDKFARLQGRASFIQDLLLAIGQSASTLEKLK